MKFNSHSEPTETKKVTNKEVFLAIVFLIIMLSVAFKYREHLDQILLLSTLVVFIYTFIRYFIKIFHSEQWEEFEQNKKERIENYVPSRQFRIFAGIFSIYFWVFTIIAISIILDLQGSFNSKHIKSFIFTAGLFIISYSFTYIAITGRVPKIAKKLLKIL